MVIDMEVIDTGRLPIECAVSAMTMAARGRRTIGLFIAATAFAASVPLSTRGPADFAGLDQLLDIVVL